MPASQSSQTSRRTFLQHSAVAGAALPLTAPGTGFHIGGDDVIRIGLIGCGGRGTGAAAQMLRADKGAKIVALGDMFTDRLDRCLNSLKGAQLDAQVDVPEERRFVGFDAYEKVIASGVDVIALATPPHFRPMHFEAAVKADKHVFTEKPIAVDGPGVVQTMKACEEARKRNLNVVSGLCWRYHAGAAATMEEVLSGRIGDVVAVQSRYLAGTLWSHEQKEGQSDMEWMLRNWLYFTWLSGDHIIEQHVHSLDKMLWAFGDVPPVAAVASGGRQVRTDPRFGHIYDHFNCEFEFEGGRGYASCRQMAGTYTDVSDHILGANGIADVTRGKITGQYAWSYDERSPQMHQAEQTAFMKALREGRRIDNGHYMTESTLMGIMGREAAYTGKRVTREDLLNSKKRLGPSEYALDMALEVDPVPMPGKTQLG